VPSVPLLSELCLRVIVANFRERPLLAELPPTAAAAVLERLDVGLPLSVTAPVVAADSYWQRCAVARWPVCNPAAHGGSWKRLFFERNLQELLEAVVPGTAAEDALDNTLAVSAPFVVALDVGQLWPAADAAGLAALAAAKPKAKATPAAKKPAGGSKPAGGGDVDDDDDDDDDGDDNDDDDNDDDDDDDDDDGKAAARPAHRADGEPFAGADDPVSGVSV
jgi:hypothetical protein